VKKMSDPSFTLPDVEANGVSGKEQGKMDSNGEILPDPARGRSPSLRAASCYETGL
jgi:hypothetical protein